MTSLSLQSSSKIRACGRKLVSVLRLSTATSTATSSKTWVSRHMMSSEYTTITSEGKLVVDMAFERVRFGGIGRGCKQLPGRPVKTKIL